MRNNLLGRDTQAFMESLPNPRTKNNKSSIGLAQQDKEADSTRTPKHLQPTQTPQRDPVSK